MCPVGVVPPILGNTTACGCGVCDDVSVQVHITVVNRDTDEPISAAVVMRNDGGEDSYNILGVTNQNGRYMYTEKVGRVYLELKIIAKGYMSQTTLPMRLQPYRHVIELRVVMIPKMIIDVGLGGSNIVVRLGTLATVSAPAGEWHQCAMSDSCVVFVYNLLRDYLQVHAVLNACFSLECTCTLLYGFNYTHTHTHTQVPSIVRIPHTMTSCNSRVCLSPLATSTA